MPLNLIRDRFHLSVTLRARNHKIIGEGRNGVGVQQQNIRAFFVFDEIHNEPREVNWFQRVASLDFLREW